MLNTQNPNSSYNKRLWYWKDVCDLMENTVLLTNNAEK